MCAFKCYISNRQTTIFFLVYKKGNYKHVRATRTDDNATGSRARSFMQRAVSFISDAGEETALFSLYIDIKQNIRSPQTRFRSTK